MRRRAAVRARYRPRCAGPACRSRPATTAWHRDRVPPRGRNCSRRWRRECPAASRRCDRAARAPGRARTRRWPSCRRRWGRPAARAARCAGDRRPRDRRPAGSTATACRGAGAARRAPGCAARATGRARSRASRSAAAASCRCTAAANSSYAPWRTQPVPKCTRGGRCRSRLSRLRPSTASLNSGTRVSCQVRRPSSSGELQAVASTTGVTSWIALKLRANSRGGTR